jgi:threonine/homoserine/homoserine lactone efflux protein
MTTDTIVIIIFFAVSMIGSPGPANMALMAAGARYGYRASIPFVLGVASGFLLVGIGVAAGLGTLFEIFPALRITFLILSAAYILYLAYKIAFTPVSKKSGDVKTGYFSGLLVHPLNPKAWAMLITAYSQFSNPELSAITNFLIIQTIFQVIGISLNSLWCAGGDLLARLVQSPATMQRINQCMAALMIVVITISVWQSGLI